MLKPVTEPKKRFKAYALKFIQMHSTLPNTTNAKTLSKQRLHFDASIGRETARRHNKLEFRATCGKSLPKLEMAFDWFETLLVGKLAHDGMFLPLSQGYSKVTATLVTMRKESEEKVV